MVCIFGEQCMLQGSPGTRTAQTAQNNQQDPGQEAPSSQSPVLRQRTTQKAEVPCRGDVRHNRVSGHKNCVTHGFGNDLLLGLPNLKWNPVRGRDRGCCETRVRRGGRSRYTEGINACSPSPHGGMCANSTQFGSRIDHAPCSWSLLPAEMVIPISGLSLKHTGKVGEGRTSCDSANLALGTAKRETQPPIAAIILENMPLRKAHKHPSSSGRGTQLPTGATVYLVGFLGLLRREDKLKSISIKKKKTG